MAAASSASSWVTDAHRLSASLQGKYGARDDVDESADVVDAPPAEEEEETTSDRKRRLRLLRDRRDASASCADSSRAASPRAAGGSGGIARRVPPPPEDLSLDSGSGVPPSRPLARAGTAGSGGDGTDDDDLVFTTDDDGGAALVLPAGVEPSAGRTGVVMMAWERPYMEACVLALGLTRDDTVLEIGWGLG